LALTVVHANNVNYLDGDATVILSFTLSKRRSYSGKGIIIRTSSSAMTDRPRGE